MNRICVYSGSNLGNRSEFKEIAEELGKLLAQNKIELVYGGSRVGLMGVLSNSVLKHNGTVTGVMPKGLFPEDIINKDLTTFIQVADMQERKKTMANLSEGFIALPGGVGTFEELFEVLSWSQLGIHAKPIGILNIADFFQPLIGMLDKAIQEGFMNSSNAHLLLSDTTPNGLLNKMKAYSVPDLGRKWKEL